MTLTGEWLACEACAMAKGLPHPTPWEATPRATKKLDRVSVEAIAVKRHVPLSYDACSRSIRVCFLAHKSDVAWALGALLQMLR